MKFYDFKQRSIFSKVIKAGDRQREFNFTQVKHGENLGYQVDVSDDRSNRIGFRMHRSEDGKWTIVTDILPDWIRDAEPKLEEAINENFQ